MKMRHVIVERNEVAYSIGSVILRVYKESEINGTKVKALEIHMQGIPKTEKEVNEIYYTCLPYGDFSKKEMQLINNRVQKAMNADSEERITQIYCYPELDEDF